MSSRTSFGSSTLVRLLGELAPAGVEPAGQDVAQQLSGWLGVLDTIALDAAHRSIGPIAPASPPHAHGTEVDALQAELLRVRGALVDAIEADARPTAGSGRDSRPAPARPAATPAATAAAAADPGFAPWQRRYLDRQRRMEARIGTLRGQVRQALARASPRMRQLATLDAILDQMFGEREKQLFATVPGFLERRFTELRPSVADEPGSPETPPVPPPAAGADDWRDRFESQFQAVLLAELDSRLQPVIGLIEAFAQEDKGFQ